MSPDNPAGSQQPDQTIDLDKFLNLQANPNRRAGAPAGSVAMPEADRMVLVGIFVDDSGSIQEAGLTIAVVDGLKLCIEALKGAKGSDFHLDIRGFKGSIFTGLLKDVEENAFDNYHPDFHSTPLITHATAHLKEIRAKASQYRNLGIPTIVALLIITDGFPNSEEAMPSSFKKIASAEVGEYIVGMGVAPSGQGNDEMAEYHQLFTEMGVGKVMTPRAAAPEVRHAINQFSQSVASIATASA